MKWDHVRDLIAGQLERIESVDHAVFSPCKTRKEFEKMSSTEYQAALKETNRAIEFLIRTGHWPVMLSALKIAQRFSAGFTVQTNKSSPAGTIEPCTRSTPA